MQKLETLNQRDRSHWNLSQSKKKKKEKKEKKKKKNEYFSPYQSIFTQNSITLMKHVFLCGSGLFRLYVRIILHHFAEKYFKLFQITSSCYSLSLFSSAVNFNNIALEMSLSLE